MASMSLRFKRLVAIFGASVALAAGVAQAQQVFISIQQITCLRKTAGEQHSDSVYFTLAGATPLGTVAVPKIGPNEYFDHFDMNPGDNIFTGLNIHTSYLAPGNTSLVLLLMRESDTAQTSQVVRELGLVTNSLASFTPGVSLSALDANRQLVPKVTSAFANDGDQTLGNIGIVIHNSFGALDVQAMNDAATTGTTRVGSGSQFQTLYEGAGAIYQVTWAVFLTQGSPLPNVHSQLCLDVPGFSMDSGVRVQQYPCNGGANQKWIMIPDTLIGSPNYFTVVNQFSGKCLDVRDASLDAGAVVQQFTCHGGNNQHWRFSFWIDTVNNDKANLINGRSGLCLDVPGASLFQADLQQYYCGIPMQKNQLWKW